MRRAVVMCLLLAAACGGDESKKPAADGRGAGAKGTLVFARGGDSKYLDPALVTDGESVKVCTNLFDTLIRFKPGSAELAPGLATSWEASKDGLAWTFHLRDAKFHDGTLVDADAVVFSFLRQRDADHPAHVGEFGYWNDNFGAVQSVRAVDPRTVEMRLAKPSGTFEATMALFSMAIESPTAWASAGKGPDGKFLYDFKQRPVGSGPFKFKSWSHDDTIVLEAFADHWEGPPKVGKVVFKTITDNAQRLLAIESGQADVMDGMNPQDAARVRENNDVVLEEQPGLDLAYLAMNTRKKPFDDVRVRQAIAFAIDKETIRRAAYDGTGEIAVTMLPRGMPGWKQTTDRRRDVEKARRLLVEAGLANGFSFTLLCGERPRPYMPRPEGVAIQIQQDLRAIGVEARVEKINFNLLLDTAGKAEHDACLVGWSADYGDADNFLYPLLDKDNARVATGSNNLSFYVDETVHEWLVKAREITDHAERARLYALVQDKVLEDAPVVPLMQMPDQRVRRASVKGYRVYPVGGEFLHDVSVE
jgi:peptide/nickel transport system substrate-binding protein